MLPDFFSRVVLLLKFFSSVGNNSSGKVGSVENPLVSYPIVDDLFNGSDTVIIENPHLYDANNEVPFFGEITLPICCDFDPHSSKPFCTRVESWKGNENMEKYLQKHPSYWYPAPEIFPSENTTQYRFPIRKPTCPSLKVVKVTMDEFEVGRQGRFLVNGYFGYSKEEFYSPHEYCIASLTGEFVQVLICESSPSPVIIQKCCDPNEIYSFSRRECIKSRGALFRPIFYHDLSHKLSDSEQENVLPHYHIVFPRSFKYHCEENRTQIFPAGVSLAEHLSNLTNSKYYSADFKIRKDGMIMYRRDGKPIVESDSELELPVYRKERSRKCHKLQSTVSYCIDGAGDYGSENPFGNEEGEIFLVTCSKFLWNEPRRGPLSIVYGNVMITSSIFSLLTVVVYMVLKEKQNIHGWTIASYAFSMFLMYIFLGLAHLIRYYWSDDVMRTPSCVAIGIASHLFSMSSFLWLTLMNWDIWWTFRKVRPSLKITRGEELRHFLMYSMFGWGIPIIITGISTFLHFTYEEASEDNCADVGVPLPAYGRESCEIKQLSLGVYLYYPAAFLLTCNFVFFIVTTSTLCRHSRQTQLATKSLERHRQSLTLFAKLFFVMGVTRVFEVLTWAESGTKLTWYWAVFDIFNVLQAVAIFIIYVCKRDVLDSLKKLWLAFYHGQRLHNPGRSSKYNGDNRSISRVASKRLTDASSSCAAPLLRKGSPEGIKVHVDVNNLPE